MFAVVVVIDFLPFLSLVPDHAMEDNDFQHDMFESEALIVILGRRIRANRSSFSRSSGTYFI
jgi:hypothetical protein